MIYRLLRLAWERFVEKRGLPTYELANRAVCAYFTAGVSGTDRVSFHGMDGKTGHRQLMGYKTLTKAGAESTEARKRFWHFAVQARPLLYPRLAYVIRAHVLFSSDGSQIWMSKDRLHRARRSACRDWWNDDWRDRVLAAMSWLALGAETIKIELGPQVFIEVATEPARFLSPVSYLEPEASEGQDENEDDATDDDPDDADEGIDI